MNTLPLTRDELERLVAAGDGPSISLFLPTNRFGPERQQDRRRLVHLLSQARQAAVNEGLAMAELAGPFEAAVAFAESLPIGEAAAGIALFLGRNLLRAFHLELPVHEAFFVGHRFQVRPLLAVLEAREPFYVLAVSLHSVRVLEVDGPEVHRLDLAGVPANIDQALGYVEYQSDLQMHSAQPSLGRKSGTMHGHGDGDEERMKRDISRYLQLIAEALEPQLPNREAPLVLMAVEEYFPIYRAVSRRLEQQQVQVAGNADFLTDREIAEKARPAIARLRKEQQSRELSRLRELAGNGRVAADLAAVLSAAITGRVNHLLAADRGELWGRFEIERSWLTARTEREPADEELVNRAVLETLSHGGEVSVVRADELPSGQLMVAALRY
ncbi:MAG TPA: hypothetical protein VF017_10060 [Thermoanaerobaculia bacterium]|nr:hypothetical protein [Thermoanaerobaculia bacterium]